ncbi:MAG: CBS domain-containing protein [Lachnospiraceae bacterium]|jgi:dTDP-glucose pyrophosphorylase|nr:CBS domain-containing protein [Lachnospiraceae bacterium]
MRIEELKNFLIHPDATVVDAMQKIDKNAKGILFVVDDKERLCGSLTDGDVRRWLIKTGNMYSFVENLMNKSPKFLYSNNVKKYREYLQKHEIRVAPVVTPDNVVCDIVFLEGEYHEEKTHQGALTDVPVVIMAGGKGTRLYPYTKVLPKPLIPIGDIPIMERIIDRFRDFGVKEFWATVNYKKGMIKSYFGDVVTDYDLFYVEEDRPLGTAGSLHLIEEDFDKPIIVTNCDILIQADYADVYRYHKKTGNALTIVTALKNIVVPYGVVHSKEQGRITGMEEKPKLSYFVNTGMYVLNPEILKAIPKDTFFHMTDVADMLLKQNRPVGMYPISEDSFLDMGEFEEMHRMEQKLDLKSE